MAKIMKMINNISRSQAIYRQSRVFDADLQTGHYAFCLEICRAPGRSQEELARELCLNKSTVTRNLGYLEERGYIRRELPANDRRRLFVYPTEKMQATFLLFLKIFKQKFSCPFSFFLFCAIIIAEKEVLF